MMPRHATNSGLTTPDAARFGPSRVPRHNIIVFIIHQNGVNHARTPIPGIARRRITRDRTTCRPHHNVMAPLHIDPSDLLARLLSP